MALEFPDWKGIMRRAEDDLPIIIAKSADGRTVVWSMSRDGSVHQVRYCLQNRRFTGTSVASREFAGNLVHMTVCKYELFPDPARDF